MYNALIFQKIEKIQLFLLAFFITARAPLKFMDQYGWGTQATMLGFYTLAFTLLLSLFLLIVQRRGFGVIIAVIFVFTLIYLYQNNIPPFPPQKDLLTTIMLHGIAGVLCGFVVSDVKSLAKFVGIFSIIYGVFLIPEPFTYRLLGYTSMGLGYTLAPLTIYILLFWYFEKKCRWFTMLLAVILGGETLFFTSRGCGLSIIVTIILIKMIDNRQKGISNIISLSSNFLTWGCVLMMAFYFMTTLVIDLNMSLLTGSSINKLLTGMLVDDNGRAWILEDGIGLFKQYWAWGVGIGNDREILGYVFVHNAILELFLNFGLFVALILLYLYWRPIISALKNSQHFDTLAVIAALLAACWIRLLFSGSYIESMFSIMLIYGIVKNKMVIETLEKERSDE